MRQRYPPHQLYNLKRGCGYPPSEVIERLKICGIFHNRGRRGGRHIQRPIPVVVRKPTAKQPAQCKPYKHVEVPRLWYDLPSLLLSNVTSLNNKMDEAIATVRELNPGVVAFTEAWQIQPEVCCIEGYQMFHHLRKERRGGGVVIYCHQSLTPTRLTLEPPEGCEVLWIRAAPPSHPRHSGSIIYCLAYHPPRSASGPALINHIIETTDMLRGRYPSSKVVICGDFNELNTSELQQQLHLTQVVDFNTNGHNILDLIFTDLAELYLPPQPLPPLGRSTHLCVLWAPSPTTSPPHTAAAAVSTYRPITDSAVRQFGQWVQQHPWTEVLEAEDVNDKWNNYVDTITTAYHSCFPIKTARTHPSDAPWLTPRIKRLIRQRNKAFYTDTVRYRSVRNKVIREIKSVKKNYYPTKIHHLKHSNISQWYTKIKAFCGLGKHSSSLSFLSQLSPDQAAEEINGHFAGICQTLPDLDPSLLPSYLPAPSPPPVVEQHQVAVKLLKFKSKRSTTPVDIPMKLYHEFAPELSAPLCSIINASLAQCKCPLDWKTSYTTPIPKVTNPTSLNELRPIAITPIPSLLCEDFIFEWISSAISTSFDPQQFGNIKSSSTTHCLVSLLDFLYQNLEKRKTSVALTFIDFKKAFDLVDHKTIITKALKLGSPPHLISWLANFLTGRRQATRYQDSTSSFLPLTCGVPQGSKTGPLCFLILINDALNQTNNRWKYVDDSTVGTAIDNTSPDYSQLQNILDELVTWTAENHVTINHNKTVVMHFTTAITPVPPPTLHIGQHQLQVVDSTKLLGITIDKNLDWKEHVTNIVKKASFRLYMLRRMKTLGTPPQELTTIYTSFILPVLLYASPAWSSSLNITQQRQIEKVQKRAFRTILAPHYNGYNDALNTLGLPSISERLREDLTRFGQKLIRHPRHRNLLPPALSAPVRNARRRNVLKPIRARTDRYKNSPIPTIVNIINNAAAPTH